MEGNVVLCHELVQLDLVWILPPLSPLGCVAGSDRDVAVCNTHTQTHTESLPRSRDRHMIPSPNGGVEPNVEDLLGEPLQWDGSAPVEVTTDAARLEAVSHPGRGDVESILRPHT